MLVEVVLGVLLLGLVWLSFFKKPQGLPPGRWGLPIFGYIPLLTKKSMMDQIKDLHKEHGDIYLWRFGSQVVVFLHSFQLCKQAFSMQEVTDRPDWEVFKLNEGVALGVGSSNGKIWHDNRRFSLRQLRDLGMGKSKMVTAVQEQAQALLAELTRQSDKVAPVSNAIKVVTSNVIWQMVAGKTFDLDDPKHKELDDLTYESNEATSAAGILDFFPILKKLPKSLKTKLFKLDAMDRIETTFTSYFSGIVDEHRATLDRDNPRDLIDSYLIEMENNNDPDAVWTDLDLVMLMVDLFLAGTETTSYTLLWMFYYMASNPDVQTKLHTEIDEVLPKGTLATLEDRARLPYTEAAIQETLRLSTLTPLGFQHQASKDLQLGGYLIPKGTVLSQVPLTVHQDPRYWECPEKFMPERWLDQDGKFNPRKDGFLPFGIGKRACLGESLARMELLIFSTTVFQSLEFAPPKDGLDLAGNPDQMPFFNSPKKQGICITLRGEREGQMG